LIDAISWLAHRPLDAVCPGHPDLYILVKKDEDGLARCGISTQGSTRKGVLLVKMKIIRFFLLRERGGL